MIRRILTWPKRKWRSKGFGIHSPFAFEFVTEVLAKGDGMLADRVTRYIEIYRKSMPEAAPPPRIAVYDGVCGDVIHDNGAEVYLIADIDKGENRTFWEHLTAAADCGMDFSDYRTGIICRFPHLPRQSFKVIIKN